MFNEKEAEDFFKKIFDRLTAAQAMIKSFISEITSQNNQITLNSNKDNISNQNEETDSKFNGKLLYILLIFLRNIYK